MVGLEVHCELATTTKLFCGCRNKFGEEPNTNVCPVCLGLPGSLPVLNAQAVELAMRIGTALHCDIHPSSFARKNYFYPDQAKDYQISQYDEPINLGGWLELPGGFRVGVTRAHLEEDTGKLTHVGAGGRINSAHHALVDYNRSGVPLVEIVSEPDIRSAAQARAYASELRGILVATGASDGRLEEGSMRFDANVSVRPVGAAAFGTRCEIKNLNSLRSLGRAIEYEAKRQIALIESGDRVSQETRHWDEAAGRTADDALEGRGQRLPLLPRARPGPLGARCRVAGAGAGGHGPHARRSAGGAGRARRRVGQRSGVGPDPRRRRPRSGRVGRRGRPGRGAGQLALARAANELAAEGEAGLALPESSFVALLQMESKGELSATQAKAVLSAAVAAVGSDPRELAKEMGFEALGADTLSAVVDDVVAAHPDEWARFVDGDDKLRGFFTGAIMKATSGQANGKEVAAELLRRRG